MTTHIPNLEILQSHEDQLSFMEQIPTCTPTKKEINAFTNGDCWAFALEVNRVYGYPIVVHLFDEQTPDDNTEMALLGWCHAYNMLPNSYAFDVTGVYQMDDMEQFWGELEVCREGWSGAYLLKDKTEERLLFERRDRLYPKVSVAKAVRKAHRAYVEY